LLSVVHDSECWCLFVVLWAATALLARCAGHEGVSNLLFVPSKTTLPEINVFKIIHLVGSSISPHRLGFAYISRLRHCIQSCFE
jgi:hypothetical protein